MNCKKLIFLSMALSLILTAPTIAQAVSFVFNPNDLIELYPATAGDVSDPSTYKAVQANARRVHQTWASTYYETFYNASAPHLQPNDYNTYRNWRASLGSGEGISRFNIWMLDNPAARSWGERVVWNPIGAKPTAAADTAGFWNANVISNPWGPGWLAEWWTDNSAYYLRPDGADISPFRFGGTAYSDNNMNGYDPSDPMVMAGEQARVWFGCLNDPSSYSITFDDLGFGCRSPSYGAFAANDNSGWEGVLSITAAPSVPAVPEPGTLLLLGSGLVGIVGYGRIRFGRNKKNQA